MSCDKFERRALTWSGLKAPRGTVEAAPSVDLGTEGTLCNKTEFEDFSVFKDVKSACARWNGGTKDHRPVANHRHEITPDLFTRAVKQ